MNTQAIDISRFSSVTAQDHAPERSNRFTFIPTTRVIDILEKQGWKPAKVQEKAARVETTKGFQTHLIRFRQEADLFRVNSLITHQNHLVRRDDPLALFPEIVLKNAHDGTAAFQIMAGIFRLVCANGLIIADSMFQTHKIKHIGFQDQNVIEAVYDVMETTPKIMGRINDYKQIELDKPEQTLLAQAALTAKYGDDGEALKPYNPDLLIRPIRQADRIECNGPRNTLWNTYNILQEKLVEKGGRFQNPKGGEWRARKARGVKSVSENVRINQALWMLTEEMAKLKGAAAIH